MQFSQFLLNDNISKKNLYYNKLSNNYMVINKPAK